MFGVKYDVEVKSFVYEKKDTSLKEKEENI